MVSRAAALRCARQVAPLLPVLLLFVAACGGTYPQSTLSPKSDFTAMIDGVFMTTVYWAAGVFVLVEGALVWAILRYRGKPDDPEPPQLHGNTTLEIVWTVIPALILAMIAVPTVRAIFRTYEQPKGADVLQVEVTGHQWWWEFYYPQYGVTTANELHVPVGRTVSLKMGSFDVIHSFWMPALAAKRDVFPDRKSTLWFRADSTGFYPGQCAEFCGTQHGRMAFHVAAESDGEFDAYIKGLKATAPDTTAPKAAADTSAGAKLFVAKACSGCHTLDATRSQRGLLGPNLANVGARRYIAAGTLINTDENLAHWIQHPWAVKHGVIMPELGLSDTDVQALAAYLRTHTGK